MRCSYLDTWEFVEGWTHRKLNTRLYILFWRYYFPWLCNKNPIKYITQVLWIKFKNSVGSPLSCLVWLLPVFSLLFCLSSMIVSMAFVFLLTKTRFSLIDTFSSFFELSSLLPFTYPQRNRRPEWVRKWPTF